MAYHFTPRLMKADAAAFYLGISASKLRTLDIPTRKLGRNRLYDVRDLDAFADSLDGTGYENSCDALFEADGW